MPHLSRITSCTSILPRPKSDHRPCPVAIRGSRAEADPVELRFMFLPVMMRRRLRLSCDSATAAAAAARASAFICSGVGTQACPTERARRFQVESGCSDCRAAGGLSTNVREMLD
jgi:hypothetical protein